ncbi:hypothetical protein KFE25_001816 [Diacronema lutheri]|uniref:RING-type domain-containing protein n=1 Tax=Diacronema lutheri TaxID=2081491 RepID=A0A8J6CD06_DIALT|nr:hypothetical protein KFE25_001816 [Diacronema lutheri]
MDGRDARRRDVESEKACECPICLHSLCEPLSLECGHAFCRLCLLQSTRLAPDGRACPLCRRLVGADPATHPVDAELATKVRTAIGDAAYTERVRAHSEKVDTFLAESNAVLPIFTMPPGASVGAHVNLHLFEPRYKILIRRAIAGNRLFVFTAQPPHAGIAGVVVRIDVARFLPDGRCNISGVGIEAVRLGETWVEEGTHGLHCTRTPVVSATSVVGGVGARALVTPAAPRDGRAYAAHGRSGATEGRTGCCVM